MNQNSKTPNQQPLNKGALKGCALLIITAVIIFAVFKSCFSSTPEEEKANKEKEIKRNQEQIKIKLFVWSQSCVKEKLKSPGSAEFPFSDEAFVNKVNDSVYSVSSYVDSQNSFGALIRVKYVSRITIVDDEHYKCDDVMLLE